MSFPFFQAPALPRSASPGSIINSYQVVWLLPRLWNANYVESCTCCQGWYHLCKEGCQTEAKISLASSYLGVKGLKQWPSCNPLGSPQWSWNHWGSHLVLCITISYSRLSSSTATPLTSPHSSVCTLLLTCYPVYSCRSITASWAVASNQGRLGPYVTESLEVHARTAGGPCTDSTGSLFLASVRSSAITDSEPMGEELLMFLVADWYWTESMSCPNGLGQDEPDFTAEVPSGCWCQVFQKIEEQGNQFCCK